MSNRVIVGMRSKRLWTRVDPRFEHVGYLTNPQCSYFSRGNMDGNLFKQVSDALRDDWRVSNWHSSLA
jgi:hypothetical protein